MSQQRLNDFREVAQGYQAMAREFERQLDRETARADHLEQLLAITVDAGHRILDRLEASEATAAAFAEVVGEVDASRRQTIRELREARGAIIDYYEPRLDAERQRFGELAREVRVLGEVYASLYNSHFGPRYTADELQDDSAYKRVLNVLEGGPRAEFDEPGRSDFHSASAAAGRGDGSASAERAA